MAAPTRAQETAVSRERERPPVRLAALTHQVRPGETAWGIARSYGVAPGDLLRENGIRDPHYLYAGRELRIPGRSFDRRKAPSRHRTVELRAGETLWRIAQRHGVSVESLARLNDIDDVSKLAAGTLLRIPESRAVPDVDLVEVDALLVSAVAALDSAEFERAGQLTDRARGLLEAEASRPGPDRSAARAARAGRLEVIAATLAVAYGQHGEAVACLGRALRANPALDLDADQTSPKLLRALRTARLLDTAAVSSPPP